jgi:hypothetical protein
MNRRGFDAASGPHAAIVAQGENAAATKAIFGGPRLEALRGARGKESFRSRGLARRGYATAPRS